MRPVCTRRMMLPPVQQLQKNRAWKISRFGPPYELKTGDYPRSFNMRPIIHARVSDYPRSSRSGHGNRRSSSHGHSRSLVLLAGAGQVVGRGLVDVIVEPVGVEQLSLAAPDVTRLGGGIVAREVMRRHLRVEPALHVALVL